MVLTKNIVTFVSKGIINDEVLDINHCFGNNRIDNP